MTMRKTIYYGEEKLKTLMDLHISPALGAEFASSRKRRGMMYKPLNEHGEEQLLITN